MYYNNESIYIMQINNINDILISYGIIKEILKNKIIYIGNINSNYEYSPIFNSTNNKLIGFHKNKPKYHNNGIFFKIIIKDYRIKDKEKYFYNNQNNKISILLNVNKNDVNNDKLIYFLDDLNF